MILIAQPHTGLPAVEKRLRPTPARTDSLESRASADVATEQPLQLFIQPSPPPYVLPTSSTDRSRSGGKRKTSRDVCRAVCGIFAAFIVGLSGALICIWLYWEGFSAIVGRKKGNYDQPPAPDATLGQVLSCEMRWFFSNKNGLPSHEVSEDNPIIHDDIELPQKKQDGGKSQLVFNLGNASPTQLEEDDDDFGVYRGSRAYYAATMGFYLPSLNLTKDEGSLLDSLFLFASGEMTSGVIRIATKEQNETATDPRIQVDLVARFWNTEMLTKDTSVCAMRRGRELGIALVGRKKLTDVRQILWLDTTITIPVRPGQTLDLDHLTSDVPSFKLVVGLEDKVRFRSTRLHSGDAPVTINSLTATDVDIKTSNFPIKGVLTAQKSAKIVTENSPLEIDITTNGGDFYDPSVIALRTSNNRLDAVVRLASLQPRGLNVESTTSNGRMNVTIPHAAWGTHLSYKGSTSNADATIELPTTFAGTVHMAGSKYSSLVSGWTEDPTGHGYTPKMKSPRLHLYQVWYESERDLDLGHVELRTVNGAAAGLILGADSTWRPPRDQALP
ncbi:hypothetical protein FS837_001934 [Tulasnella sp. UAMH 9824]|nr:hypothetical protein FS837_001934 [Tulasnella sp. UAMH 9824]